jgi:hypothetical protein
MKLTLVVIKTCGRTRFTAVQQQRLEELSNEGVIK